MEISGTKQAVEMWADIERAHHSVVRHFEEEVKKFQERFAQSPVDAISWRGGAVIAKEWEMRQWAGLMAAYEWQDEPLTLAKMVEFLKMFQKRISDDLLNGIWQAESTSIFHNAADHAMRDAAVSLNRELTWMVMSAEGLLKKEATEAA